MCFYHLILELFNGLETQGDTLNVQSFGVAMTTLEEVFLKIGEDDEGEEGEADQQSGEKINSVI